MHLADHPQPLVEQSIFIALPLFRTQHRMEPVVADRHRRGHLRGIEEVRGIPVLQRAGGIELADHPVAKSNIAGRPPRPAAVKHVVQRLAGLGKQPLAVGDEVFAGPLPEHLFGPLDHRLLDFRRQRIRGDPRPHFRFLCRREEQPRMRVRHRPTRHRHQKHEPLHRPGYVTIHRRLTTATGKPRTCGSTSSHRWASV